MQQSTSSSAVIGWALFLLISIPTSAAAAFLPIVTIWETPNATGGTYTISVDSTQSDYNWYIDAFAVTASSEVTGTTTDRDDWSADLISIAQWDSGQNYEIEGPSGGLFPVFSTGAGGVGTFAEVFGAGPRAAVFWTSYYTANTIGANATSSQFYWLDGVPASTAFVQVTGGPNGTEYLSCPVGVGGSGGECTALETGAIPLPAAAWLFGSGLLGLIGMARRKKA
ncbi:MAG: VPLPA-CTERM sorting domain-containing protein [Gammaproteobacteria bacterium]